MRRNCPGGGRSEAFVVLGVGPVGFWSAGGIWYAQNLGVVDVAVCMYVYNVCYLWEGMGWEEKEKERKASGRRTGRILDGAFDLLFWRQ